ncbi:DUF7151 family protein [Ramlibacter tataouinensis]|uniref:DUF7151 domain-containing protein n=1 Tax=Ramlibacter tataouinensis (strain ATCC BAA-407 / DSM 14655 / LMG 21543 / TTB310) TaxID=365046 RepID=F5Y2M8_RAMTT|nr:hypothetical protein [Ramlibacter tataouinensis]AEG92391.1 conserved hypothetical protein [Ramlibacter tataouinensis TTB310]
MRHPMLRLAADVRTRHLAPALFALLLSACGGGGGGGAPPPAPAPAPGGPVADGGGEAAQEALVELEAEPAGPRCAAGGTRVQSGIDSDADGVLDDAEVTRTAYVCAEPVSATAPAWRAGTLLSTDNATAATMPDVAANSAGETVAVWVQDGQVWASRRTGALAWQAPQPMSGPAARIESPRVAVNAQGQAVAVWVEVVPMGGYRIRASHRPAGGAWSTPVDAGASGAWMIKRPAVAMDPAGNAMVLFSHFDSTGDQLYAARYTAGMGWSPAVSLASGVTTSDPQIGMDAGGNAVAAWHVSDGSRTVVRASRHTMAGGWAPEVDISNPAPASAVGQPRLVVAEDGGAVLAWAQEGGGVYLRRYAPATGWNPTLLQPTSRATSGDLALALDAAGRPAVAWVQWDGAIKNLYVGRQRAEDGWEPPALIEFDSGEVIQPRLKVDSAGRLLAVWQQSNGTSYDVRANRFMADAGWGLPAVLETSPADVPAGSPQLALSGDGTATLVWEQDAAVWFGQFR